MDRRAQQVDTLHYRHNERDSVPNNQHNDCLLNRLSRRRSKKISKLRVTGLCAGNSPVTGEFPTQRASNAENVVIWWRHHVFPGTQQSDTITVQWYDPEINNPCLLGHIIANKLNFKRAYYQAYSTSSEPDQVSRVVYDHCGAWYIFLGNVCHFALHCAHRLFVNWCSFLQYNPEYV